MMRRLLTLACAGLLAGCQTAPLPPLDVVPRVDLERFMGDWYVIAHIPTWPERNAWNAVESYRLNPDGTVATTFTFREGGPDGPARRMTPTGFVLDTASNAVWGMQFIWPIRADFRIAYLSEDYGLTVIARQKRDYVWVMARTPEIPPAQYAAIVQRIAAWGYDVTKLRRVPQQWEAAL
ncbi:MAG: lipocalin family protein [Thiobacillaceae bacterium]